MNHLQSETGALSNLIKDLIEGMWARVYSYIFNPMKLHFISSSCLTSLHISDTFEWRQQLLGEGMKPSFLLSLAVSYVCNLQLTVNDSASLS